MKTEKYGRLLCEVYAKSSSTGTDNGNGGEGDKNSKKKKQSSVKGKAGDEEEKEFGVHLNQWLIDERLAVSYDGGTKKFPKSWKRFYEKGDLK